MVDYFRTLKTIVKPPKAKISDIRWLGALPKGDYLAAQDVVLERLNDFLAEDSPLDQSALDALMVIDARCSANVMALTEQYVNALALTKGIDERLWHSVCDYYSALARAYQRFLDHRLGNSAGLPHDLPQLLLNIVDCRRCLAKWHYFRYQSMPAGEWLQLHQLYRLAENYDCATTVLWRYRDQGETTVMACYLQALMLDTLTHTDMLKHEIEMVSEWLADWCGMVVLSSEYNTSRHLFFVDLDEDKGGRRARKGQPSANYRYWDTDGIVSRIARAFVELQHGKSPADLNLSSNLRLPDCQPLLEYLLTEWSRTGYRRQRRAEEREEVSKSAHVVYGIENICQHIMNITYARSQGKDVASPALDDLRDPPGADASDSGDGAASPGMDVEKWTFKNESKHGFGAEIDVGSHRWLRAGRLVAFNSDNHDQFPLVGVVRHIKLMHGSKRYVGIEVLSRAPVPVMLSNLAMEDTTPFSALYLPRDEARDLPSRLLVPVLKYAARGEYELRAEQRIYQIRLDGVLENLDDWICVVVRMVENSAAR